MAIHKGSELNNIRETWEQNEEKRKRGEGPGTEGLTAAPAPIDEDLQQTIQAEAAAYDEANKDGRLLAGERASVNDDEKEKTAGD